MDIVDKEYIENKTINNVTSRKLFTGTYDISKVDEIINDGIYIIVNTRNDDSVVCPFLLQVLNNVSSDNSNLCRQTLYDSIDGAFKVRYKNTTNNTTWTDWTAVITDGTYIKDNSITGNKLTEDLQERTGIKWVNVDDIDNLTEEGTYLTNEYSSITAYNISYIITVTTNVGSTTNSIRQTKLDVNNGILLVRKKFVTDTEWSEWEPITVNGEYIKDASITRDKIDTNETIYKMYTTGADYDKLTKSGVYNIWGVSADNKRVSSLLFVSNLKTDFGIDEIIQKRFATNNNKLEERRYTNGAWSSWVSLPVYIETNQINRINLESQLQQPYTHKSVSSLDFPGNFDTIHNLVENYTVSSTGSVLNFPTFAIQYVTTGSDTAPAYNKQLAYDANLGTFKYRSKNLTTNVWDDWTPIPIPYSTVENLSFNNADSLTKKGIYILTNSGSINYTTSPEFVVVHTYNNIIFQSHYGANSSCKTRSGTRNSDNTITWTNWLVRNKITTIFLAAGKVYNYTNGQTELTVNDFNELISSLGASPEQHIHDDIRVYLRMAADTIKLNVTFNKTYILGSYFDWDENATKYYKIYVKDNAVIFESKSVNILDA